MQFDIRHSKPHHCCVCVGFPVRALVRVRVLVKCPCPCLCPCTASTNVTPAVLFWISSMRSQLAVSIICTSPIATLVRVNQTTTTIIHDTDSDTKADRDSTRTRTRTRISNMNMGMDTNAGWPRTRARTWTQTYKREHICADMDTDTVTDTGADMQLTNTQARKRALTRSAHSLVLVVFNLLTGQIVGPYSIASATPGGTTIRMVLNPFSDLPVIAFQETNVRCSASDPARVRVCSSVHVSVCLAKAVCHVCVRHVPCACRVRVRLRVVAAVPASMSCPWICSCPFSSLCPCSCPCP